MVSHCPSTAHNWVIRRQLRLLPVSQYLALVDLGVAKILFAT